MRFALPALGLVMLSGTFAVAHPASDGKDRKEHAGVMVGEDREAGDTVAIEVVRDRKRMTLSAKAEARRSGAFRYPDADADDEKVIERLEKLERRLQKLEETGRS